MELGAIFVGLAMFVATLPFVIGPFKRNLNNGSKKSANLLPHGEQKQNVMFALRDLDFDFKTGKVSDEDYEILRAELVADAAEYFQSEESLKDEHIEAMISARQALLSKSRECSNCGSSVEADSRYCSQCGTSLEIHCPSCGKGIQDDDFFCTTCGENLQFEKETVL